MDPNDLVRQTAQEFQTAWDNLHKLQTLDANGNRTLRNTYDAALDAAQAELIRAGLELERAREIAARKANA